MVLIFEKLRKEDYFLFASAMYSQPISCSSIIEQATNPFISFHQQLGCFHSDWHQHEWGQLMYAEKGCLHVSSQEKQVLIPGWYGVWIPPNTYHASWSTNSQLHMRAICFPVDAGKPCLCRTIAVFPVSTLLREMIRYTERWGQEPIHEAQATRFLQALEDVLPGEVEKSIPVCLPSTRHPKLLAITSYIQENLAQPINFLWLSREFGLSARSLSRLFMHELGSSFSTYCKIARIMRALELIEMGYDNVAQLATAVGYESMATFSNNFLALCGQRPLLYIHSKRH
ncbi:helix-turn-helix domain-containing protein [Spirosoma flavum]|uniref:Helix-turn-helix domain-containing protein n=1 Tax=Spirosoma flavum TaxID=2048557 RepID=A0ABW6ATM7_9BACT